MTLNFNNTSNSKANNKTDLNAKIKENILNTTMEFKANELKQESMLSDTSPTNQLKLRRQKRQYGSNCTRIFNLISQHGKGNPSADKTNKIKDLLNKVNINYQDGDTFLHAAVQERRRDIIELLLRQPGIDINIRNNQGKTPFELAKQLHSTKPNWSSIINKLDPSAQPGPSNIEQSSSHNVPQQGSRIHETYRASGLKHSLHGNIYQLKLLMLFLKRGLDKGYDFRLATEWDAAEKFDDLVFKYTDQGKIKYRFLQAKHKQDKAKKISIGDLLTKDKGGEFNLEKYFISYLKIEKNPSFQNGNLEDFIICTNIDFDLDSSLPTQLNQVRSGKNKGKKFSVETIDSNDSFFKQTDGGTRYRLKDSNGDLATHLKQSEEIKKQNIQNIDAEINGFLEKLVFAINQPDELELSNIISRDIGEDFKLLDADLITDNFYKEMLDWMKKKKGTFLTPTDGNEFFEFAEQKVNKLKISGPTSGYSVKLKQYGVEFNPDKLTEVPNFLDQSQKQILNLKSHHGTRLSAIKINQVLRNNALYSAEDSHIFLSSNGLLRLQDKALNAFKAQNTGNLLVVECKNGASNVQDLYPKLKQIINDNSNKKIILITKYNNELADKFKTDTTISSKYKEEQDNIDSLNDLTLQSQEKILEKTVNFQGNDIPLRDLISDNQKDMVDGEVLSNLVDNEKVKIGTEVPKLTGIDKECYVERTFNNGEENNIGSITDKVVIIAAKPGMGKSIVLTHLAEQEKISDPSLWVIKVNLIEHTQALGQENFDNYDRSRAINFLLTITGLSTTLERFIFVDSFNHPNKIALFFDGFDEIGSKDKVIKLLQIIKDTQVKKLWITTRNHMRAKLETALDISSYELNPLSQNEQKDFLKKFFRSNLEAESIDEGRLETCTQKFLDAFANDSNLGKDFTSIPLELKMIAKYLQDEFKIFYNSNENIFSLPDNFNLIDLYEKFIKYKFDKYSKEQESHKNPSDRLSFNEFLKQRQLLALNVLFGEEVNNLLSKKQIDQITSLKMQMKKGDGYVGMIDDIVDEKPNFVHLTFAKYLAAQKLFNIFKKLQEKIDSDPNQKYIEGLKSTRYTLRTFLFEHFILQNNVIGIKAFFDQIAAKGSTLHAAFLSDINKIESMLNDSNIDAQDALGRTVLHLAVSWEDVDVIEMLISRKANITIKDNLFEWAPVAYSNNINIIEMLLKEVSDFSEIEIPLVENMINDKSKRTDDFITRIIEKGHITLFKYVMEGYEKFSNYRFQNGESILGYVKRYGTPEMITILRIKIKMKKVRRTKLLKG